MDPIVEGPLWAGPLAAARFAELRADTLRGRIANAVASLFRSAWADSGMNREGLYRIAARRGISAIDSVDVYSGIVASAMRFEAYEELAILRDCRAVALLRDRYAELRARPDGASSSELLHLCSCLYHIPCDEAVVTARELLAGETEAGFRERLERVVKRK